MDQILSQLGGLLLAALPTVFLLLLSYAAYQALVDRPLQRVLAERHARTEGAMEKAQADIAAAEAKAAEYEQRIRDARLAIYKAQEARRAKAQETRAQAVAEARAAAGEMVRRERDRLEGEMTAARTGLAAESERLATQVIDAILRPARRASSPALSGRQS